MTSVSECPACEDKKLTGQVPAEEAAEVKAEEAASDEVRIPDCCRHKTKERSQKEYKDLMNRLSRIEGQVRGVRRMLENNCYCTDVITQVAAINAALNSFNKILLADHIRTCVADDVRNGGDEKLEELLKLLQKLMK